MRGLFIFCALVMAGCGPSQASINATATEDEAWRLRAIEHYNQTQAAESTRWAEATPRPTETPDLRSDIEKSYERCTGYVGVYYILRGDAKSVSVTWENDTSGVSQGDYGLPFCVTLPNKKSGDYLYISAQIISGERVECLIYDDERRIAQASASGQANIATCSGQK